MFIALNYLGYTGFQRAVTYYYTVAELGQQDSAIYDKNVRVNGVVAPDSVVREAQRTRLKFIIIDSNGGQSLPVVFQGVAPDTFKVGADSIPLAYNTDIEEFV